MVLTLTFISALLYSAHMESSQHTWNQVTSVHISHATALFMIKNAHRTAICSKQTTSRAKISKMSS